MLCLDSNLNTFENCLATFFNTKQPSSEYNRKPKEPNFNTRKKTLLMNLMRDIDLHKIRREITTYAISFPFHRISSLHLRTCAGKRWRPDLTVIQEKKSIFTDQWPLKNLEINNCRNWAMVKVLLSARMTWRGNQYFLLSAQLHQFL